MILRHALGGTGPGGGGGSSGGALSRSVSAHYGDPYAGLVGPAGGGQPPPRRCLSTDPAVLRAELAAGLVGAHHSSIDMEAAGSGPAPRGPPAFGGSRWGSLRLDSRRWRSEVGDDDDDLDLGELSGGEEGGGAEVGDGEDLPEDSAFSYTSRSTMAEEAVTYQEVADTEPLRRFVTRTSSFSREDFDSLLQTPGMYAVKDRHATHVNSLARTGGPRTLRKILQQRPSLVDPRRHRRNRQRTWLGLPTIRPDNVAYMVWGFIILVLDLTYSAFVVPISIGMMTSFYTINFTTVMDFGAGGLFFTDLILNFHVGFIATYNMHKVMVLNPRLIARYYITKGSFISDCFSTMAWMGQIVLVALYHTGHLADPKTALVVMEGFRLMRFLRVIRLIKSLLTSCIYASISFEGRWLRFFKSQNVMYLSYILYIILLMINFIGCVWNLMANIDGFQNTWINYYAPFIRKYGDPNSTYLTPEEAEDDVSDVWKYIAGCYWALTTITGVGYGDITPASLAETLVTMAVQIMGVMFFALLLSTISELLQQVNKNARRVQAFRAKMDLVERWMDGMNLPRRLRRKIKTFYAEVWLRDSEYREETTLFLELPHVLRNEVSWHVNHSMFRCVPMLSDVDDKTLYLIASKMTPFRLGPGMDLCTEGDMADRLWVLLEGEVAALYHYNEAEHVEGPAVIGDFVLLQELDSHFSVFPCTYRTVTSCAIWMIEWRELRMLLAYRPELQENFAFHVQKQLAERIAQFPHLWAPSVQKLSAQVSNSTYGPKRWASAPPVAGLHNTAAESTLTSTLPPGENGQAGPPHAHTAPGGQPQADTYPGVASGGQGEGPGPATAFSQHSSGEQEGAAHGMLGLTPEMVNQYPPPRLPRSAWSLPVERPSVNGSGTAAARRQRQQQRAEAAAAAAAAAAAPPAGESGPRGPSAPLASSTAEASLLPSPQQPAAAEADASMVSPFSNLPRQEGGKEPQQPQQQEGEENGVKVSAEAEPSFRFSVLPPGEPAPPAPAAARSGSSGQPARFRAAAAAVGAAAAAVAAVAGRRGKSSRGSKQDEPEPESAAGQAELKGARGSSASPPRAFAHGLAEGGSGAASGSSSIKRRGSGPPLGLPAVNTGASPKPAYTRQSTGGTAGSAGAQSPRASVSFAPGSEPPAKAGRPNLGRPSSGAPALALHHPFDEEAAQAATNLRRKDSTASDASLAVAEALAPVLAELRSLRKEVSSLRQQSLGPSGGGGDGQ